MVIYKNANGATVIDDGKKLGKVAPGLYTISSGFSTVLHPQPFEGTERIVAKGRQLVPINRFKKWKESFEKFKRLGLAHKYSMLMAGRPGTGKTVIVRELIRSAIADGYICISVEDNRDYNLISQKLIPVLKAFNKEVKVLAIWDDLDLDPDGYQSDQLKTVLDGITSIDGTFFIFSSNTPVSEISDALKRPGRFDYIAEFDENTQEELQELVTTFDLGIEVDTTDCKTFAEVRGKVVDAYIFDAE